MSLGLTWATGVLGQPGRVIKIGATPTETQNLSHYSLLQGHAQRERLTQCPFRSGFGSPNFE